MEFSQLINKYRNFPRFTDPEILLPYTQELSTANILS
jgi:hypothetical protein